jgi:hypothetical protein
MNLLHELHELPTIDMTDNETGCCPRFHPKHWDEKTFIFDDMKFAKATAKSFMYMPLNFSKMMTQAQENIDKAGANDPERYFILSQDDSKWHSSHYFKVVKNVPGMEMKTIKGHFMSKVVAGDFKDMPKMIKDFEKYLDDQDQSLDMKDFYAFYTTCPTCAKHYGVNYMVFFARVS